MRIEDVPEEYRDSPITRALFAEKPTKGQRETLDAVNRAHESGDAVIAFLRD